MHRGLVHVLAWSLATGAAVTLSWWGVHSVMAGTAYDPPRALPITAAGSTAPRSAPLTSATHGTASSPSAPATSAAPSRTPAASRTSRSAPAAPAAPSPTATTTGRVKSYDTDGGRVVFDLGPAGAALVSATPGTGWSMQVWKTASWIRVEFTSGTDRVSVICTWHDGPPRVEVGNY
ncbi:hypothetical protein [Streptomyces sp. NPDC018610]|uniref:hypothetical protein n=1 Tax=Streptomyces sp. NPDC018610 TaxID=3365049 RepID=UPI00378A37DD